MCVCARVCVSVCVCLSLHLWEFPCPCFSLRPGPPPVHVRLSQSESTALCFLLLWHCRSAAVSRGHISPARWGWCFLVICPDTTGINFNGHVKSFSLILFDLWNVWSCVINTRLMSSSVCVCVCVCVCVWRVLEWLCIWVLSVWLANPSLPRVSPHCFHTHSCFLLNVCVWLRGREEERDSLLKSLSRIRSVKRSRTTERQQQTAWSFKFYVYGVCVCVCVCYITVLAHLLQIT